MAGCLSISNGPPGNVDPNSVFSLAQIPRIPYPVLRIP